MQRGRGKRRRFREVVKSTFRSRFLDETCAPTKVIFFHGVKLDVSEKREKRYEEKRKEIQGGAKVNGYRG